MKLDLPGTSIPDRVTITTPLKGGERKTLCELDGPGCIRHITVILRHPKLGPWANRKVIIRIYFDDSQEPNVEAPVGDFFGVMHGQDYYNINTEYLSVKGWNGYNCYFPMPFSKSARIEFDTGIEDNKIYLMIDWHRFPGQEFKEKSRFCARGRRENPSRSYGQGDFG